MGLPIFGAAGAALFRVVQLSSWSFFLKAKEWSAGTGSLEGVSLISQRGGTGRKGGQRASAQTGRRETSRPLLSPASVMNCDTVAPDVDYPSHGAGFPGPREGDVSG